MTSIKGKLKLSLNPDEDGMIGRECPNQDCQPKYFKISISLPDTVIQNEEVKITCPYCGLQEDNHHFHTKEQIEWGQSVALRKFAELFQGTMDNAFNKIKSSRKAGFRITYKQGTLPSVRHYTEEKLKRIVKCEICGYPYAVYGISFHCPSCSEGSILQHLSQSVAIIKALVDEHNRIVSEKGIEVGRHLLCNALEDAVSLYEGFLKNIYTYYVKKKYSPEEAQHKIKKINVNFQKIDMSEYLFLNDFGLSIYEGVSETDKDFLQSQFLKRHIITHNLGLVDEKYREKAQSFERQGSDVEILPEDILRTLITAATVIETASKGLINRNK